jgi:hypothetical protein
MPCIAPPFRALLSTLLLTLLAAPAGAQPARFALLKKSLSELRANSPASREALLPGSQADVLAMAMPVSSVDWKVQMMASEWLLRAHLARRATGKPLADGADLAKAWELAWAAWNNSTGGPTQSNRGNSPTAGGVQDFYGTQNWKDASAEFKQALKWLLAETSNRLRDPKKMAQSLEPLDPKESFLPREGIWVMMNAFHAGRFDTAAVLYRDLVRQAPPVVTSLRDQALRSPGAFDYTVLTKATFPVQAKIPITAMVQSTYQVRVVDEAEVDAPPLLRLGVSGHWLRPLKGTLFPMSGAMDDKAICLFGYGAPGTPLEGVTLQVELKPDASRPNRWIGVEIRTEKGVPQRRDVTWELIPNA